MDPNYKPLQQQADKLHHKCSDIIDDRDHPLAQLLIRETKEIREDIESNKPPRKVEDRVKQVQKELEHAKDRPVSALSPDDADLLFDGYERLREDLRQLSNY